MKTSGFAHGDDGIQRAEYKGETGGGSHTWAVVRMTHHFMGNRAVGESGGLTRCLKHTRTATTILHRIPWGNPYLVPGLYHKEREVQGPPQREVPGPSDSVDGPGPSDFSRCRC